jgi:hypothetical protein
MNKTWYEQHKEITIRRAIAWRKRHPDLHREGVKKWKRKNKAKVWEYRIKEKYKLSPMKYKELFNQQSGRCAICRVVQSSLKKPLFVDHNHRTSKIRGLLCTRCNSALGFVDENIKILLTMVDYLYEHN